MMNGLFADGGSVSGEVTGLHFTFAVTMGPSEADRTNRFVDGAAAGAGNPGNRHGPVSRAVRQCAKSHRPGNGFGNSALGFNQTCFHAKQFRFGGI